MKTNSLLFLLLMTCISTVNATTKKVLFIGNSYTYVNNLPQVVASIAASTGDTLVFDANAVGGYRLMDHTTDATSLAKIALGNWDYVVLQEQSQMPAFPLNQVQSDVLPYAHQLDSLIHVASPCAKTLFYMTWGRKNGDASNCPNWPPLCTYSGMDSLLRERYLMMANDNHALVAPAGPIWRNLRNNFPTIDLYQSDESHPSEAGTYAIACGFYAVIFKKTPLNIPYNYTLSSTDAQAIKNAAKLVAFDSLSFWNVGKYSPQADFQFTTIANLQVSFTNSSLYANTYQWQFGDGNSSTSPNPNHTYTASGTYQVSLIASKCDGADTSLKSVTVNATNISAMNQLDNVLYPNPINNELHVLGNWEKANKVMITSVEGKMIQHTLSKKENELIVFFEPLAAGVYFITIEMDGKQYISTFEKK